MVCDARGDDGIRKVTAAAAKVQKTEKEVEVLWWPSPFYGNDKRRERVVEAAAAGQRETESLTQTTIVCVCLKSCNETIAYV